MVRIPGLEPGRRTALTTAPDLAPTILELAGVERPASMQGASLLEVLGGTRDEHRPFVLSSWPLYFAEGEITTAVDSRPRRISSYMPLTVATRDRSLILGGPSEEPELYDLTMDPGEETNIWEDHVSESRDMCEAAISFLERHGTPEEYLTPRRAALDKWLRSGQKGPASTVA